MTKFILLLLCPAIMMGCFKCFKPKPATVSAPIVIPKASLAHRLEADAVAVAATVAIDLIKAEAEKEEKKLRGQ